MYILSANPQVNLTTSGESWNSYISTMMRKSPLTLCVSIGITALKTLGAKLTIPDKSSHLCTRTQVPLLPCVDCAKSDIKAKFTIWRNIEGRKIVSGTRSFMIDIFTATTRSYQRVILL